MIREVSLRRPVAVQEEPAHRPLYARMLRLKHLTPSGFLCFTFLEGAVALGILLALAELVSWWGVLVLPATVAVMVKLNDGVAGAVSRPGGLSPHGKSAAAATGWASNVPGAGRASFEKSRRPEGVPALAELQPVFAEFPSARAGLAQGPADSVEAQAGDAPGAADFSQAQTSSSRPRAALPQARADGFASQAQLSEKPADVPAAQAGWPHPQREIMQSRTFVGQIYSSNGPAGPDGAVSLRPTAVPVSSGDAHQLTDGGEAAGGQPQADRRQVNALRTPAQSSDAADVSAVNGPPASQWVEELDSEEQRARQSAARRYE